MLLDRDGEALTRLLPVDRTVVPLDSLPAHVADAFIAVEDRRFFDHDGVDWRRVLGALAANLRAGRYDEGASTITMQLARNLFPDRLPASSRTLRRKLLEARVALAIERRFTKPEILELYLNHVYFGKGAYGIEAAAIAYFDCPASQLSVGQAATLAALLRAPSYYDPETHPEELRARRDLVLDMMASQGLLDTEAAGAAAALPLRVSDRASTSTSTRFAGYFIEQVRASLDALGIDVYRAGLVVRTTLDVDAETSAERRLAQQLTAIEDGRYGRWSAPRFTPDASLDSGGTPYVQGAFVMMDPRTGDVLALVGGRSFDQSTFDRAVRGRRQIGSAFKPFVYAAALADGFATSQPILDAPYTVALSQGGTWEPDNYGGEFEGMVSMREALVRSRNVTTVRLSQAVGIPRVIEAAAAAGIGDGLGSEPSLALGTVSLSPLQLTAAYTPFANLGARVEPRFITSVELEDGTVLWTDEVKTRSAIEPAVAFIVTDMLQDAIDTGTGSAVRAAGYRSVAAGKTGTTSDAKDAWFVGYTPDVVASVWIGFDQPRQILPGASGGTLAAPVWGRVMQDLAGAAPQAPDWVPPAGIEVHPIDPETGLVLDQQCRSRGGQTTEVFLEGRVPEASCPRRRTLGGFFSSIADLFRGNPRGRSEGIEPEPGDPREQALGTALLPGTVDGPVETPAPEPQRRPSSSPRRAPPRGR